jgi:2-iminobutanoate/2-iminopropanoate deaminase
MSRPAHPVERLAPETIAAPGGHYSPGVAFGDLVFISGQLPIAADGTHLHAAPFEEQVRQTLANVLAVAKAAGAGPEDILKVTVFLVGVENWPAFNRIYAEMFGTAKPARSVVPVPGLHYGYLVEIEAVAARRSA